MAHDMLQALHVLHVICTRMRPGHLSVHVGDSLRHTEEIVQISHCAFECNYYYYHLEWCMYKVAGLYYGEKLTPTHDNSLVVLTVQAALW